MIRLVTRVEEEGVGLELGGAAFTALVFDLTN